MSVEVRPEAPVADDLSGTAVPVAGEVRSESLAEAREKWEAERARLEETLKYYRERSYVAEDAVRALRAALKVVL